MKFTDSPLYNDDLHGGFVNHETMDCFIGLHSTQKSHEYIMDECRAYYHGNVNLWDTTVLNAVMECVEYDTLPKSVDLNQIARAFHEDWVQENSSHDFQRINRPTIEDKPKDDFFTKVNGFIAIEDKRFKSKQLTQEFTNPPKEKPMSNKMKTIHYLGTRDISEMGNDDIVTAILAEEQEIERLSKMKSKSTAVNKMVKTKEDNLAEIIKHFDARK